YKNWVVHTRGGSEVMVEIGADGKPSKITIRYAAQKGTDVLDSKFLKTKEGLEKIGDELGVKVEIQPMDLNKFLNTLPTEKGGASKWEGMMTGLHSKKPMQMLERRGLK